MDDEESLYVSDTEKHEVRRWRMGEKNGTVVAGGNGEGNRRDQLDYPYSIVVDQDHSVYVSDWNNHRVMKWMKGAKEGIIVAGGNGKGDALTQLHYPNGLFVDRLNTVYVADSKNHRIMRWPQGATSGSVNKRLHAIVHDSIFTNCLTLMKNVSVDSIDPLSDPILDQFFLQILPSIHHKIKWFNLESSSMKRILLATNYPNLYGLGLYDIEIETALSFFSGESCLTSIDKNQIFEFVIKRTTYGKVNLTKDMNSRILARIFTTFSNLQYLNFCASSIWNEQLAFLNPYPGINSSTLLELHILLVSFSDCLYILDGRFNKLHTLHVDIFSITPSDLRNNNQKKLPIPNIRCFSLYCEPMTNVYDEVIVPHLQRMSNLEKLSLNLGICDKNTFVDGNELKQNIINYMPQLKSFQFYICSHLYLSNQIYLPSKEDIQHTFRDFKDDQVISYIDYFQKEQYSLCHIYSYSFKLKYYYTITNNFPGGLFKYVHELLFYDECPFEHEFFLQIAQSFPFIKRLSIKNSKPQNNKLCKESKNDNQDFSVIKFPHLICLTLNLAHDDYIEEFLVDTRICLLNNNVHLNIFYHQLKRVTHHFTRDTTRINCAKLNSLCFGGRRLPKYAKDYFPHV
ncbi:unnamed protein product [Rotaria sp. Silwood1]|nr:unnamed protein product [Rotaria sp. Silwood1]CAF1602352.1 unnamed protein product [Rotaria sp. Silwood1]CAF3698085.1 unnamed protein product [Rotaria sp. Silwood1]CAF4703039.1 unnamed protein product [Rotaria sp. Silwood1]